MTQRRILVVDDLRDFGPRFEDADVDYARTCEEALLALAFGPHRYDEIWLDHDLGPDATSVPVARGLEVWAQEHRAAAAAVGVRILSDNGPGRRELTAAMKSFRLIREIPKSLPIPQR